MKTSNTCAWKCFPWNESVQAEPSHTEQYETHWTAAVLRDDAWSLLQTGPTPEPRLSSAACCPIHRLLCNLRRSSWNQRF